MVSIYFFSLAHMKRTKILGPDPDPNPNLSRGHLLDRLPDRQNLVHVPVQPAVLRQAALARALPVQHRPVPVLQPLRHRPRKPIMKSRRKKKLGKPVFVLTLSKSFTVFECE